MAIVVFACGAKIVIQISINDDDSVANNVAKLDHLMCPSSSSAHSLQMQFVSVKWTQKSQIISTIVECSIFLTHWTCCCLSVDFQEMSAAAACNELLCTQLIQ